MRMSETQSLSEMVKTRTLRLADHGSRQLEDTYMCTNVAIMWVPKNR